MRPMNSISLTKTKKYLRDMSFEQVIGVPYLRESICPIIFLIREDIFIHHVDNPAVLKVSQVHEALKERIAIRLHGALWRVH